MSRNLTFLSALILLNAAGPSCAAPAAQRLEADVVVIGAGAAGLAAAISAGQAGAQVVVLEKTGAAGGALAVSEGVVGAVNAARQRAVSVQDSPERFAAQMLAAGGGDADPVLVRRLAEQSESTVAWLESLGVAFREGIWTAPAAGWRRSHYPASGSGAGYAAALEKAVADSDGKIRLLPGASAGSLVIRSGRVREVSATRGGARLTVTARRGVVLATGGFASNPRMLQSPDGEAPSSPAPGRLLPGASVPSAAGDGIAMALKAGAAVTGMGLLDLGVAGAGADASLVPLSGRSRIFVNGDGNRFIGEDSPPADIALAALAQPDGSFWIVANRLKAGAAPAGDGSLVQASSLEEAAARTGTDPANLKAAVAGYNALFEGRTDPLGLAVRKGADARLTGGAWYAARMTPAVRGTLGGVRIDAEARVLNTRGEPIPGLYAAGEVTGGIHGKRPLAGGPLIDAFVFGRIAGRGAALGQ